MLKFRNEVRSHHHVLPPKLSISHKCPTKRTYYLPGQANCEADRQRDGQVLGESEVLRRALSELDEVLQTRICSKTASR